MSKEKSLVEEAILQMKNLEEAVAENAKGILASTMKEEIKELVKESLSEQDEEDEVEMDVDMEKPEMEEPEMEDDEEGMDMDTDNSDEEPIDLTNKSDEEVLRVFQLMGPDDHIVVTKDDNGNINLKDTESDKEYMIVGESEEGMGDAEIGMMEYDDYNLDQEEMAEDDSEMEMDLDDEDDEDSDIKSIVGNIFDESYVEEDMSMDSMSEEWEEQDEMVYEIEMDEDDNTMGVEEVDDMDEVVYEIGRAHV